MTTNKTHATNRPSCPDCGRLMTPIKGSSYFIADCDCDDGTLGDGHQGRDCDGREDFHSDG